MMIGPSIGPSPLSSLIDELISREDDELDEDNIGVSSLDSTSTIPGPSTGVVVVSFGFPQEARMSIEATKANVFFSIGQNNLLQLPFGYDLRDLLMLRLRQKLQLR